MDEKIDPVGQIDLVIRSVEYQMHDMKTSSGPGSSSSRSWLEGEGAKLAPKTIDTISREDDEFFQWDVEKTIKSLEKEVGELRLLLASERYMEEKERKELLQKLCERVNEVKPYSEQMSDDGGKLRRAAGPIVKTVVSCCDYLARLCSHKTAPARQDVRDSLALSSLEVLHNGEVVFLCHSDTQKNFIRQLYLDLRKKHVSCSFDEDDFSSPHCQMFPPLIFNATETCKMAVLVLSVEFIRSKLQMKELAAFSSRAKERKDVILLPIFFMIAPNKLSGITKDSPECKEWNVSNDIEDEWRKAIKHICSIKGIHFSDGNEVTLRNEVVKRICSFRRLKTPKLLEIEPVGIGKQVEEVKSLLDMEGAESALAVIVCGFRGVGTSTLAAAVVDSLDCSSMEFNFCRVEIDDETPYKQSQIMKLQTNFLYDLGEGEVNLQDPTDGKCKIKAALSNKRTLLFMDNVVDKDYVKYLIPTDSLEDILSGDQKTKLRIILTSTNNYVKAEFNGIMCKEYGVKVLSDADSKNLLSKLILQDQPVKFGNEKGMINEVAVGCRGVPLLLSVFGKHLRGDRDIDSYQEAIDVLKEGSLDSYRDENLGTQIMFEYDRIKDVEVKEAFLDICIYFHGREWGLVEKIVNRRTLKELERRMLVSQSGSGEVIVPDILRFLGEEKARLTRFSNYKDLKYAMENKLSDFRMVKGISLVNDDVIIESTLLEAMLELRLLVLGDSVKLNGTPSNKVLKNLRYFRTSGITAFPFKKDVELDKLRASLTGPSRE